MKSIFKIYSKSNLGYRGFEDFERKFIRSISLVAASISFAGAILNGILGFGIELIIMPALFTFFFLLFWHGAVSMSNIVVLKTTLTIFAITVVNFLWYYNYGSNGPAPYFYIIIYAVLIFIWQGKQLFLVSGILLANILCIFYIDYANPDFVKDYQTDLDRVFDVYTGVLMYAAVFFVLLNSAKWYLQQEYEKAKRSDMLKSAFLANMSHEIRTPMNSIMGYSQLLKDESITPEEKMYFIDTINKQGEQLLALINDIIDISRIEAGVIAIREEAASLNEILKDVEVSLRPSAKEGVDFNLILDPKLDAQQVIIDPVRLKQVVTNLVSNSLKFTYKGYVEAGCTIGADNFIEIYVRDTGIGIPLHETEKIFERFYQVEIKNKSIMNRGTGLGLAISKALILKMGGSIAVVSEENVGSTFTVRLPYKPVHAVKAQTSVPQASTESSAVSKATVLVVEDIKSNFLFIKHALMLMDCKVEWCENGAEAVKYLEKKGRSVDLILMDMKMPVMDGYTATRMIKKSFPDIPVIAQTAYVMDDEKSRALDAGCDDYITKPIHVEQLKAILNKHLH